MVRVIQPVDLNPGDFNNPQTGAAGEIAIRVDAASGVGAAILAAVTPLAGAGAPSGAPAYPKLFYVDVSTTPNQHHWWNGSSWQLLGDGAGSGADGVVTGASLAGTILTLTRSIGAPVTLDLAGLQDGTVTGASLAAGTLTLTRSIGAPITVNLTALQDGVITSLALVGTILTANRSVGAALTVDLATLAGAAPDGVVTGASLAGTTLTLTRSVGAPVTVNLSGLQDGTVTGAALAAGTLTLTRSIGADITVNLAGLQDGTVTGISLTGNVLTLTRSVGADVTVDLSGLRELPLLSSDLGNVVPGTPTPYIWIDDSGGVPGIVMIWDAGLNAFAAFPGAAGSGPGPIPGGSITPATVALTVGDPVATTLVAAGGTAPYTWAVFSGSLPAGLVLNTATGEITGTPTTAGAYAFTIRATDANGDWVDQAYSGSVSAAVGLAWGASGAFPATNYRVAIVGDAQFVIASVTGQIAYSTDHGATWTLSPGVGSFAWYGGACDHATNRMVLVGNDGVLGGGGNSAAYSVEGGVNWTAVSSGLSGYLMNVRWNGQNFVAINSTGQVAYSPNGVTWTAGGSGFIAAPQRAMAAMRASGIPVTMAAGNSGALRRSLGLGSPAGVISSPTGNDLVDGDTAGGAIIFVGEDGTIIRSIDFGATFTTVSPGLTTGWLTAAAAYLNALIAWGVAGAVLRSTDNGTTWALAAPAAAYPYVGSGGTYSNYAALGPYGGLIVTQGAGYGYVA